MLQNPKLQTGFWSVSDSGCLTGEIYADIPKCRPCQHLEDSGPKHFRGAVYCTAVLWTQLGWRGGNHEWPGPSLNHFSPSLPVRRVLKERIKGTDVQNISWATAMSQAQRRARNVLDSVVNCVTSNSACSTLGYQDPTGYGHCPALSSLCCLWEV